MVRAKNIINGNLQQQKIKQLNNAIEIGVQQLKKGQKVTAKAAYQRIKEKLMLLVHLKNQT